jgi:hypothetical protein
VKNAVKTILCMPGTWPDREAFFAACARAGFAAAGAFLVDSLRGLHLEIDWRPRDERMGEAFASASGHEIEGAELDAIGEHQSVVYLVSEVSGLDDLRPVIQIATRLLPVGGLGIKVESAGVAAPIERWLMLSVRLDPFGLVRCFVVVASSAENGAAGDTYSCGMHNLGFPDAAVRGVTVAEAKRAIDRFNLYQLVERPTLRDGQTFAAESGARGFVMHHEPSHWPKDDPYFNPYGVFRLTPQ